MLSPLDGGLVLPTFRPREKRINGGAPAFQAGIESVRSRLFAQYAPFLGVK